MAVRLPGAARGPSSALCAERFPETLLDGVEPSSAELDVTWVAAYACGWK